MFDRALDGAPPAPGGAPLRLMEVGCGEGLLGAALARTARERGIPLAYTGSDLSPAGLEVAREFVTGDLLAGDAHEVMAGLPPASQDVVVVKNLLHHLDDPAGFLAEAARVAGPTGRVVIVEARLGCVPFFLVTFVFFNRRERHYFKGRRRNLLDPVAAAGLVPRHTERFSWFPFELAFAIRVDWFRRLVPTAKPRFLRWVETADDTLARLMPWGTCYEIWDCSSSARGAAPGLASAREAPAPGPAPANR